MFLTSFALLISALLPQPAHAKTLYEGTVGTAPIVLELEDGTEGPFGRYFYRRTRFDSDLSGEQKGDTLTLESRLTEDRLALTRHGQTLSGTLTTAKGRALPVSLHVAAPPPLPPGAAADLDGYARLQLAGLSLTPGATARIGTRTIRWVQEPISKTRLFRLESGYAPDVLRRINAALTETQWEHVRTWFDCSSSEGSGVEIDEASAPYLSDRFVSYSWQSSWGCAGAAHPDFGINGFTYDAHTGAALRLDDLLRFGDAVPPPEDSDAFYRFRSDKFAPGLVALLKRYHPDEMVDEGPDGGDDGCNYADPDVWEYPAWYLTAKGLFVGAYFPRVNRACDAPEWAVLPWKALNGPAMR
jgi:hypothetical protein